MRFNSNNKTLREERKQKQEQEQVWCSQGVVGGLGAARPGYRDSARYQKSSCVSGDQLANDMVSSGVSVP
ncbi:hypothetical protein K402DRAFT_396373 [Aulographum hederae CBS 113979]|uniref:Uncharacterized protein n=1 Tax=Aulographum hederae CBS 113979 TaxID=1176131 RepID=A0A6G1GS54_9PEZI|nr:hypothetical protein K402DRAFT_396373 [Aulographum hederae CBS 113979]